MKNFLLIAVAAVLVVGSFCDSAEALQLRARHQNPWSAWHGNYAHTAWGTPVALVVPPTVEYQTNWGWGVGNTRVTPITPQFQRNWPGPPNGTRRFHPTPAWPNDTNQFGTYYIRGPW